MPETSQPQPSPEKTEIIARERTGKRKEKYSDRKEKLLALGRNFAIRKFNPDSIEDLMYLHAILRNPQVKKQMSGMEEVDENYEKRMDDPDKTYINVDLAEWMEEKFPSRLYAVCETPDLDNKLQYNPEVYGFVYIYESEIDWDILTKLGAIQHGYEGELFETSTAKSQNAPRGVGIEGRIMALQVFKSKYLEKNDKQPPIFITEIFEDNLSSIKSVIATGYKELGTYIDKETGRNLRVFKLDWQEHERLFEYLQKPA